MVLHTVGWALLHHLAVKKMPHRNLEQKEQYDKDCYSQCQDVWWSFSYKKKKYGTSTKTITETDQWHKIEDSDMGTCNYSHMIFDKEVKSMKKLTVSSINYAKVVCACAEV